MRLGIALLALMVATPALAAEIRRGETILVPKDEVVEADLYAFGTSIRIEGEVRGDVIAFGSSVVVPGRVRGSLVAAGQQVDVFGTVGGSVRAAAADLRIAGEVGKDAVVAGSHVELASAATIGQDLIAAGETVSALGPVGGTVRAAARQLTLEGRVGRDVEARAETLTVGQGARVAGTMRYSASDADISQQAKIGSVVKLPGERKLPGPAAFLLGWLRLAVGLFALGLLLRLIAPRLTRQAEATLRGSPLRSLGFGALGLLGIPIAAVMFFVVGGLLGGWWVGVVALLALAVAVSLSFALVGLYAGDWLVRRFGAGERLAVPVAVGAIALALMMSVPVLGGLVAFAAMLFGLGALLLGGWDLRRLPAGV